MAVFAPDLAELFKERSHQTEFRLRDEAYKVYESAFLARSPEQAKQYVTWRPIVSDSGSTMGADAAADRQWINLCRQIVHHHQATFSRPPATWNVPYTLATEKEATRNTNFINGVFRRSRIKASQPIQAYRLACRGDTVYGIDWSKAEGDKHILIRAYDPWKCYPDLDQDDPGACRDMLIKYDVSKDWAEQTFNVAIHVGQKKMVSCYYYWTGTTRVIQVEDVQVSDPRFSFEHDLGFCPFRWVYNAPNGHMAQADIAEIPKLQGLMSDTLVLALDAARKRIDKAFWGRGITGDAIPQAGKVISFPNPQAHIEEFPTADPPEGLFGVLSTLQSYAQAMGGISPISMEGFTGSSIVTGTAVRHQVEAIEARTETKRVALESAFAMMGEYVLRVLEKEFPDNELTVQTDKGEEVSVKGMDVNKWYTCEASYGDFVGLGAMERANLAMSVLGRLAGDRKAISIAFPDEDVDRMVDDIRDYQLRQAAITGQSQATAQAAAAGGQQGPGGQGGGLPAASPGQQGGAGQMAGGPPSVPPGPEKQPPGMAQAAQAAGGRMVQLGELEALINVVRPRLHGGVWAVGELAVAGQSATPRILVERKEDLGTVATALQSKGPKLTHGKPNKDEPAVSLL